jgi:protein ImuB
VSGSRPARFLVLWGPAWPLVSAGLGEVPAVVTSANKVTAVSGPAMAAGVRRGMRRRQAQSRCGDLVVAKADDGQEARAFEPVVKAVESLCTGVEILRPGALALATRGPSRYFGGDEALAAEVIRAAGTALEHPDGWRVGIADGVFAAGIAARLMPPVVVVPPGETARFLAEQPVDHLPFPKLVSLLHRLGIHTLGRLAEVPEADLSGRFGPEGVAAHRLARGGDDRPLSTRRPPPDLERSAELDPPAERVDAAAFVAKALADELATELDRRGLTCHSVRIEVETEHDEVLSRTWRHDGPFTAAAISDRLRWQMDGWLNGPYADRPTAGINWLRLVPTAVSGGAGQRGLWGGDAAAAEKAARALARVQGLLGPEAVLTAVPAGGRGPGERVRLIPWGDPRDPDPTAGLPWPGQVPAPAPALVHRPARRVELVDDHGAPVRVSGRGLPSAAPVRVSLEGGRWTEVEAWAGPWPADEKWWDAASSHRRCRLQLALADGTAHLCVLEKGEWSLEATYG